jgi:hypothetical protein
MAAVAVAAGCERKKPTVEPAATVDSLEYTPVVRELLREDVERLRNETQRLRAGLEKEKEAAQATPGLCPTLEYRAAATMQFESDAGTRMAEELEALKAQRDAVQLMLCDLHRQAATVHEKYRKQTSELSLTTAETENTDLECRLAGARKIAKPPADRAEEPTCVVEDWPNRNDLISRWSNGRGYHFRLDHDGSFRVTSRAGKYVTSGIYQYDAGRLTLDYQEGWQGIDQLRWLEGKRVLESLILHTNVPSCHAGDRLRGTRVDKFQID